MSESGDEGYIYYMRVTKNLLNNLAEADVFTGDCNELIGSSISYGRLIPVLGKKVRELVRLINVYCGEEVHPHLYKQHSEDIRDIAKYLICVILSLINSGWLNETILRGLIKSLSMIHRTAELDLEGNTPSVTCENYTAELKEVLRDFKAAFPGYFQVITPQPATCPQRIPIEVHTPWAELFLINLLDGVNPEDLEAAGAICTGVGIAAGLLAAGLTGVGAVSGLSALPAGEAAVAGAALLAVLPSIDEAQAAEIVGGIIEKAETCSVDESHCCLPGGEDPPDGIDQDGCYALDGEWGPGKCGGLPYYCCKGDEPVPVDNEADCEDEDGDWTLEKCGVEVVK